MKKSKQMTPEVISQIKDLLDSKLYYQHEIAAIVGVNQGRVSEVYNGFYN